MSVSAVSSPSTPPGTAAKSGIPADLLGATATDPNVVSQTPGATPPGAPSQSRALPTSAPTPGTGIKVNILA